MKLSVPIEPFYSDLGRRVQHWRVQRGLTQQRLGELLSPPGTRASIGNIEGGKQRVLAHTLVQLAAVLNVGVQDLLPTTPAVAPTDDAITSELRIKLNLPEAMLRSIEQQLGMSQTEKPHELPNRQNKS